MVPCDPVSGFAASDHRGTGVLTVHPLNLKITYGTSRGQDTYGYTLVTLRDMRGNKLASTCGGGYDMRGTVFGQWLQNAYAKELLALVPRASYVWDGKETTRRELPDSLYGMTHYSAVGKLMLDGACGFESMCRIAEALGLDVALMNASRNLDILTISQKD
jgi:hypothetical protein